MLNKVLKKITPTSEEIIAEKKMVEEIRQHLKKIDGKHSHIEWCGSSARCTHLKGDKDLDLFIMYNKEMPESELEKEGLRTAKKLFRGEKWEKAYSQHPYIRGIIKGFEVELVPSYMVASGSEKQSAVDRTPFHNKFLLERMTQKQQEDTRLLKQFLKGINAYGADLKNCALPGYGVELLILKHESFIKSIKAISEMNFGHTIVFENQTKEKAKELFEKTNAPLILIDPVDANRNVASALSLEQFERMVYAAKLFLKKPSEKFFFPTQKKAMPKEKAKKTLKTKELLAIRTIFPKNELEDIVWGQLRRQTKKIVTYLKERDFAVESANLWGNGKKALIVLQLENIQLQKTKKITGPLASDEANAKRFLDKKRKIISGPRVEEGRLVLEIEREETSAQKALEGFIKREKKESKLMQKARALNEKGILLEYNGEFAKWLSLYLEGKEVFE